MQIEYLFSMSNWSDIKRFLELHYRDDLALCNPQIFKWQFQCDEQENVRLLNAYENEKLVGVLGYVKHEMFWGDFEHTLSSAWIMNWMVDENHRNGLGWVLLRKLMRKHKLVLSIGANEENQRIVRELGWHFYPYIKRYVAVINEKRVQSLTQNDMQSCIFKESSNQKAVPLEFKSEYNPKWSLYEPMKYSIVKHKAYLQWRYFSHPVFCYKAFYTGPSERPAVCIYRIEEAFGDFNEKVCKIVEFFHPSDQQGQEEALSLLGAVFALLKAEGVIYADFTTTSAQYGETLLKAGFCIEKEGTQLLPARLTPVERKVKLYNFEHSDTKLDKGVLESMYISWADCDEDRLASLNLLKQR